MILGLRFLVVNPNLLTTSGRAGCAMLTRFCTSSVAMLMSVPTSKVTVILLWPLLVLLLAMYDMPGLPFTWVSIAVVVVCSTVCASAPVNMPVILTVGGAMSGDWEMGKMLIEIRPTKTITIEMTMAVTGLLINTSAIILTWIKNLFLLFLRRAGRGHIDRCAFAQVLHAFGHNTVSLFQAVLNDHITANGFPNCNPLF